MYTIFAFVLMGSVALGCWVLYFRLRIQQKNTLEDYKRLFYGIPTPMYIYDDQTFCFLAVNDAAIE